MPCAEVEFATNPGECEVNANYDPMAGACVLQALRIGEPAELRVRDCPGGQFSARTFLQVFGDGTVLWDEAAFQDIGGNGRATWRALPEPSHFEACSADSIEDLQTCLGEILAQECQLGEPSCD